MQCEATETAIFDTPAGQSCAQYAGSFVAQSTGYLLNPDATSGCQFCPYTRGNDYLASINIKASDKWRDFGIFLAFCCSNWALVYFFVWSVRIKGWSFGFGKLFGGMGQGVSKVKGMAGGKKKEQGEGEA